MSKKNDLTPILETIIACAKAVIAAASSGKELCENIVQCGTAVEKVATTIKGFNQTQKIIDAPEDIEVKEETPTVEEKTYTLEEVRAILSAKSKAGFREEVRGLITKRGVDNLTKLDASEYPSLVKDVEGLTHG